MAIVLSTTLHSPDLKGFVIERSIIDQERSFYFIPILFVHLGDNRVAFKSVFCTEMSIIHVRILF